MSERDFKVGDKVRSIIDGASGIVIRDLRNNPFTIYDWMVLTRRDGSRFETTFYTIELEPIDELPWEKDQ